MNKNILNEINRYREIMGLPLLDEEKKSESYKYSWGNGGSGNVNLGNDDVTPGNLSIANNIGSANLSLFYGSMQPTVQPVSKTETKVITIPSFTLVGGKLNYNDNCVLPIVNVGEAKEEFDKIVNSLVNYINNGGFEKIESITIQGSADSGKPSTSGNDHVEAGYNNPFNGETDLYKMNQFLADERAKKYGLLVSNTVKEATGKDISSKYKYLKGENFYGQSNPEGGRVGERKIDFIVNAPELKVADKVETSSTITPVDENHKSTTIVITKPDGTTTEKQGIQFITQSGASSKNRVQGFYPNDESLSEIVEIPTGVVEGEIVNGRLLRLNGKDICSFYSNKQHTENNPSYTCKVTGHRGVERDGIILVKDYYFNLRRPRPYS